MALPDSSRGDRRQAAAPLEPQQPGRLCGRRDARHDPRGDGVDRLAPGRARDHLPRRRHPVEPGADDARGRVLPRARPRPDRRVSRTSGRPIRGSGGRAQRALRQTDPRASGCGAIRPTRPPSRVGSACYPRGYAAVAPFISRYSRTRSVASRESSAVPHRPVARDRRARRVRRRAVSVGMGRRHRRRRSRPRRDHGCQPAPLRDQPPLWSCRLALSRSTHPRSVRRRAPLLGAVNERRAWHSPATSTHRIVPPTCSSPASTESRRCGRALEVLRDVHVHDPGGRTATSVGGS